ARRRPGTESDDFAAERLGAAAGSAARQSPGGCSGAELLERRAEARFAMVAAECVGPAAGCGGSALVRGYFAFDKFLWMAARIARSSRRSERTDDSGERCRGRARGGR